MGIGTNEAGQPDAKAFVVQHTKIELLVMTSKRQGSLLKLAPTNRKSLLETLLLSARQLGQQRVTGGRRQSSQIYLQGALFGISAQSRSFLQLLSAPLATKGARSIDPPPQKKLPWAWRLQESLHPT